MLARGCTFLKLQFHFTLDVTGMTEQDISSGARIISDSNIRRNADSM